MQTLTSRQRLLRLFQGKQIDRVPVWLLAPYHPLGYYADIYRNPAYAPLLAPIETFCDTFDRRRPELGFCYNANPGIRLEPIAEEGREGTRAAFGGLTLEKYVSRRDGRTSMGAYVTDPEQFVRLLEIPYVPPRPDLASLRRESAELGERGLFMLDLGDPLEVLYHLCSAEDFSVWTLTDYETLLEFTDEMYRRVLELYRYFLENGVGDVFFIVGAEFAGPPLVSPARFNELSVRYVKGIVDLIRAYGKYSIVHYHGNIRRVLDGFAEIAPDGIHTIEAPPIGDCSITQARQALGRDRVLIGNLQYDDLVHRTEEELDEMVRRILDEGKEGRFILSPTAGPYEERPTQNTVRNYLAFIRAGIRYGGLGQ